MKLDDLSYVKNIDQHQIYKSLHHFPDQCMQGFEAIEKLDIPTEFQNVKNILACAMGGSILGGSISKNLFEKDLKIPFLVKMDYDIPNFVDQDTLAIIVSTSGSTEETLSCFKQALKKTKKIISITTGKNLEEYAKKSNTPLYLIDAVLYNPSNVPRYAVGFQLGAYIAILNKLKLLKFSHNKMEQIVLELKELNTSISVEMNQENNQAKIFANKLQNKIPIYIASEHLFGTAKAINNQTNESSRTFSSFFELPDMNHHQLEGLSYPKSNPQNLLYFFIESKLYHSQNQKRYNILASLLDDMKIPYIRYTPKTQTTVAQALETVQFATYMTYYLGLLNGDDPAPNPFVDEFKKRLGSYSFQSYI